jgi:hypothetical protein
VGSRGGKHWSEEYEWIAGIAPKNVGELEGVKKLECF